VSRVGGKRLRSANEKVGRHAAFGSRKLLSRELEAFAQLGTELDPVTHRQVDTADIRLVELLNSRNTRADGTSSIRRGGLRGGEWFLTERAVAKCALIRKRG